MNIATWSIHKPIPAVLLFIIMTFAGLFAFKKLPVQSMPDIDLPTVVVNLTLPGASPSQLENEVARKVENTLATISGLKHLTTTITDSLVTIKVEFYLDKSLSDALIETKDKVDSIIGQLPMDLQSPSISAVHVGVDALVTYAASSPSRTEEEISWLIDDFVQKKILTVKGVGKFERIGGVDREIRIEIDPIKIDSLGITVAEVSQALKQVQTESSGGSANINEGKQIVRTIGTIRQASEIRHIPIALQNGKSIRLDQIANIVDDFEERSALSLLNGKNSVGFKIFKSKGYGEDDIYLHVKQIVEEIARLYPDLVIKEVHNTVDYTFEQYHASMHMLYEGAVLAIIVVWFFLKDWRATMIAATALPLSIIPSFAFMYWAGYTLNTITLLSQAVVVGILVDDAIVEIENIVRHKQMGKTILQAAEDAVNEIALAVIATTFTLIVVFLPTSFMSGVPGLFFSQFGWTIVISIAISLLVARLITPVMAVKFLRPSATPENLDGKITTYYLKAVSLCLSKPKTTIISALAFCIFSICIIGLLPKGFLPASDRGYTVINFELPPGSTLEESRKAAELIRAKLTPINEIVEVFTDIGNATAVMGQVSLGEPRKGNIIAKLKPRAERASQLKIDNKIRKVLSEVAGIRFSLSSGGVGENMQLILSSDNILMLNSTSEKIENEIRSIGLLKNVSSTASMQRQEIIIMPRREIVANLGITTANIGNTVRIATSGDFDVNLSKINLDNRQVYIRARIAEIFRKDLNTISSMKIQTKTGVTTSLQEVADIKIGSGPSQINRFDQNRYIIISGDLAGIPLGEVLEKVYKLPSVKNMPINVKLIDFGDAEIMAELFTGFSVAITIGIVCVFCVLILLFEDFFQPITILAALPLSIGGCIIALLITGQQMSLPSMIGVVLLLGVVTKNSILLVEYTIEAIRKHGLSEYDALIDACHKRSRPILMTTVAMIAGMMPIALGFGGDSSFRQPMAIAVVGGLLTSTALSLFVIPVCFSYINRF